MKLSRVFCKKNVLSNTIIFDHFCLTPIWVWCTCSYPFWKEGQRQFCRGGNTYTSSRAFGLGSLVYCVVCVCHTCRLQFPNQKVLDWKCLCKHAWIIQASVASCLLLTNPAHKTHPCALRMGARILFGPIELSTFHAQEEHSCTHVLLLHRRSLQIRHCFTNWKNMQICSHCDVWLKRRRSLILDGKFLEISHEEGWS
jgi:hypothetical protein